MASISNPRRGTWVASVFLGRDPDGKSIRKTRTFHGDEHEAREAIDAWEQSLLAATAHLPGAQGRRWARRPTEPTEPPTWATELDQRLARRGSKIRCLEVDMNIFYELNANGEVVVSDDGDVMKEQSFVDFIEFRIRGMVRQDFPNPYLAGIGHHITDGTDG